MRLSFRMALWAMSAFILLLSACNTDEEDKPAATEIYENGVFVVNEGQFNAGSGTISFYDRKGKVTNNIFEGANQNATLGNIVQSMTAAGDTGYIAVNNGGKMVSVNLKNFKQVATLNGFVQPRFAVEATSASLYVSQWGTAGVAGKILVIDKKTQTISSSLEVRKGPEEMIRNGKFIYIANSGGFGSDSTISIINTDSFFIDRNVNIGPNPNSMRLDINGDLWVLCSGVFPANGKLVKFRSGGNERVFDVPSGASRLTTNAAKTQLYFVAGGKVYVKDILNLGANPPTVFTAFNKIQYAYGVGYDNKENKVYIADAKNFASAGTVFIFNAETRAYLDSFKVNVAPNSFLFR
jgi:DNA-binding beta-propeller fold protein YncE